MPKFLFWNLGRRDLIPLVRLVALEHDLDMVVLAESSETPGGTLEALNSNSTLNFQFSFGRCTRLTFFVRFDSRFVTPLFESDKVSIRRLELPARQRLLIAAAHLPSQLHMSPEEIAVDCTELAREITRIELQEGHSRTLLMGDFNLNPFDRGMAAANGLHAVMSKHVALRGKRTVQSREYPFFYNPMWSHLGDREGDVAGTFYYEKSQHLSYFWNTFDQILLRPDLIRNFSREQVEILTKVDTINLLDKNGRPNKSVGSDHLPILLTLDF